MSDSVYQLLTKAAKITPNEGESEQDFYERLVHLIDVWPDKKFEALPSDCRDWVDEAAMAVKESTAIPSMEGQPFDDDDADDDDTPEDAVEEDDDDDEDEEDEPEADPPAEDAVIEEEAAAPVKRGRGRPPKTAVAVVKKDKEPAVKVEPAKKSAKVAKGKSGTKARDEEPAPEKIAAKAEKKTAKKLRIVKMGRQRSTDGVLYKLLEAMYEDPERTAVKLVEVVEKENNGMKVKKTNAIGIRQQYRRIVLFLQDKGAVKGLLKSPASE